MTSGLARARTAGEFRGLSPLGSGQAPALARLPRTRSYTWWPKGPTVPGAARPGIVASTTEPATARRRAWTGLSYPLWTVARGVWPLAPARHWRDHMRVSLRWNYVRVRLKQNHVRACLCVRPRVHRAWAPAQGFATGRPRGGRAGGRLRLGLRRHVMYPVFFREKKTANSKGELGNSREIR